MPAAKKTDGKTDGKKTKGHSTKKKFQTPEELKAACDAYFDECDRNGELYGEAGLALALKTSLRELRGWFTGEKFPEMREAAEYAYLKIMHQIETDERYQEKGGMSTRSIFLMKQQYFGGYQDKLAAQTQIDVNVKMGEGMDKTDFE